MLTTPHKTCVFKSIHTYIEIAYPSTYLPTYL